MTFSHALATNNYGPAKFIVSANTYEGTHTTVASALTSASSGDTIFIRPGTYSENLTLKAGVNLTAYGSDSSLNGTGGVIISGKCTFTATGSVTISGIQLATNSDFLLAVTGTLVSVVNLNNCYLNCTNNTGISFTTSNGSGKVNIYNCEGDLGTTGITLFSSSSAGNLIIKNCLFTNTGGSSTASTCSGAGTVVVEFSDYGFPITSSSTAGLSIRNCYIDTTSTNSTALTFGGSASSGVTNSFVNTGSASSISIGATAIVVNAAIGSTNTNAITGAGTITYSGITFTNSSSTINTTTQTACGTLSGSKNTAPSAGFIGEQISAAATAVSLSNTTPKTVTSISVTAGVWDISMICHSTNGSALMQFLQAGISTATNTLQGNLGDQQGLINLQTSVFAAMAIVVPVFRVTLSTTTVYFAIAEAGFSGGTQTANARITATRVG